MLASVTVQLPLQNCGYGPQKLEVTQFVQHLTIPAESLEIYLLQRELRRNNRQGPNREGQSIVVIC